VLPLRPWLEPDSVDVTVAPREERRDSPENDRRPGRQRERLHPISARRRLPEGAEMGLHSEDHPLEPVTVRSPSAQTLEISESIPASSGGVAVATIEITGAGPSAGAAGIYSHRVRRPTGFTEPSPPHRYRIPQRRAAAGGVAPSPAPSPGHFPLRPEGPSPDMSPGTSRRTTLRISFRTGEAAARRHRSPDPCASQF